MNSGCRKNRDLIADLVSGLLEKQQAQDLGEHVSDCLECREYTLSLQRQDEMLKNLFSRFDSDMNSREQSVIEAVNRVKMPSKWSLGSILHRIDESAVANHAIAAVVIIVATLYFVVTWTWISQITECIKLSM
ncbi:MAG: anti-sigma factor family protein [Planctomycetota bacterium]|jgi:anti-sigma factor RsiW